MPGSETQSLPDTTQTPHSPLRVPYNATDMVTMVPRERSALLSTTAQAIVYIQRSRRIV